MEERRRNPRFQIMQPARLKISRAETPESHAEVEALAHNAALHGILVMTHRVIPVGTQVEVSIFLPNGIGTYCAGTVVRIAGFSANGKIGLGIASSQPFSEPIRAAEFEPEPIARV